MLWVLSFNTSFRKIIPAFELFAFRNDKTQIVNPSLNYLKQIKQKKKRQKNV